MFGRAAADAVGRNIGDYPVAAAARDKLRPLILGAISEGRRISAMEVDAEDDQGRPLVVSLSAAPLNDADGKLIGSSLVMQDITARQQAEEAGRENERLTEVDRRLREFINAAAHDLNTPLTPMKIRLAVLRKVGEDLPDEIKESLDVIGRNVERMALLVQDLLDVARLESGTLAISPTVTPVRNLLQETSASFRDMAAEKGIQIVIKAAVIHVRADARRILQVLFNLVGNAMKFTPPGGRIEARAYVDGDQVRVDVTDTGIGLSVDQITKLFHPFVQVHTTLPNAPKGTGLGLYISKGIVEAHGGAMGVESGGVGCGTTFWFTVPMVTSEPPAGPAPPAVRNGQQERNAPTI
jgi:PAS domain S-box-containing protein